MLEWLLVSKFELAELVNKNDFVAYAQYDFKYSFQEATIVDLLGNRSGHWAVFDFNTLNMEQTCRK